MAKTKRQIKKEQANMQSDAKEMEGWGEGIVMGGLDSPDPTFTYTFDDVGQLDLFSEEEMRQKYPACLLYTSPSPRDSDQSRMPSSA